MPAAIRFLMPDGITEFDDLIHGHIAVENKNLEDFVLLRSDGFPTYHLSVVVDDIEAGITHVIRAMITLPIRPSKSFFIVLFKKEIPQFVHLPLILQLIAKN